MKVRDVIKIVEADGWRLVSIEGSHRQFEHDTKQGRVTIPGHPSEDMPIGTLKNILRQAGIGGSISDVQRSRNRRRKQK